MIKKIKEWFKNVFTKHMYVITYYNEREYPITQRIVSCNSMDELESIASSGLMHIQDARSFTIDEVE